MMTQDQLDRLTPEEILVLIMEEAGEVVQEAAKCHRFGWDMQFGTGTNMERLMAESQQLKQVLDTFFHKTRRADI